MTKMLSAKNREDPVHTLYEPGGKRKQIKVVVPAISSLKSILKLSQKVPDYGKDTPKVNKHILSPL